MQETQQIIRGLIHGPRRQCIHGLSTQHIQSFNWHGWCGDQHVIRHHNTAYLLAPAQFPCILRWTSRSRTTDENHVVIISEPKQETTRKAFCNYLVSELEALEDKDFQNRGCETSNQHPKFYNWA